MCPLWAGGPQEKGLSIAHPGCPSTLAPALRRSEGVHSEVRTIPLRTSLLTAAWNEGKEVSSSPTALPGSWCFSCFIGGKVEVQGDELVCAGCVAGRSFRW